MDRHTTLTDDTVDAVTAETATLDIVDTWEEAEGLPQPPLIVRSGLRDVLGADELPDVQRIDAGHSNPTFLVRSGEQQLILRRPPRPPFAPKAHDVLREYRMLSRLRDQPVRTPQPLLSCKDPAVTGAPFYLMEALDGLVLRGTTPAPLDTPEDRALAGAELVDALVELHAVDPVAARIGNAATGSGYLERQVDLWSAQWKRHPHKRSVPAIDELAELLRATRPQTRRVSIVHGDYKLDNVLYSPAAPARLIAILDWEMATLGDPLADLGYLTATWVDQGEPADRTGGLSSVTTQRGFPTRHELADRYAAGSGLALDGLAWYQALALWKLAILLEASYQRFLAGTASDAFFATLEEGVPLIAEQALDASTGALL
jgi:aminoglycoside phosphotransferase (APT) family kinase protein